jgi:hypothetical protein
MGPLLRHRQGILPSKARGSVVHPEAVLDTVRRPCSRTCTAHHEVTKQRLGMVSLSIHCFGIFRVLLRFGFAGDGGVIGSRGCPFPSLATVLGRPHCKGSSPCFDERTKSVRPLQTVGDRKNALFKYEGKATNGSALPSVRSAELSGLQSGRSLHTDMTEAFCWRDRCRGHHERRSALQWA